MYPHWELRSPGTYRGDRSTGLENHQNFFWSILSQSQKSLKTCRDVNSKNRRTGSPVDAHCMHEFYTSQVLESSVFIHFTDNMFIIFFYQFFQNNKDFHDFSFLSIQEFFIHFSRFVFKIHFVNHIKKHCLGGFDKH